MAVEAVAYILSVRYIFNNAVFFTELLYLQAAKVLCRCCIDGIEIAVFFFKLIDLFIDMLQYFQCKLTVFY